MTDAAQLPSRISTIRSRAREHEQQLEVAAYQRATPSTVLPPKRPNHLYFIRNPVLGIIKIGVTDDLEARRRTLERACGVRLEVLRVVSNSLWLEQDLHKAFASSRLLGEWFTATPELLSLATADRSDAIDILTYLGQWRTSYE